MAKRANGEGTISKRLKNGKVSGWRGAISVGYDPQGKPIRKTVSGKTQEEVREKMAALLAAQHTGMLADAKDLTVAAFFEQWIASKERDGIKPNTVRSYRDTARLYVTPRLGRKKLEKLTPLDVEANLTGLQKDGKSPQVLSYTLRITKMALRQAVRWQMLPRNVAEGIKPPKIIRSDLQVWTPEQVAAFLDQSQTHRLHAAFYLALMTGMRRGELLGLQWDDIDWERSRLKVRHNLVEERKEAKPGKMHAGKAAVSSVSLVLQTPKTAGSRRSVVLSAGTLSKLRDHQQRQAAERVNASEVWQPAAGTDFVFASEIGTATDPRNFYRWFGQILKEANVPRIRFHDLRHTAASLMILRGIPAKTVSERLGHADVGFTLRTYTHLYDEQREEAAFELSDFFPVAVGVN